MTYVYSSVIPFPLAHVFAWHERPGAFLRLAPPWQPARLVEEATSLRDGRAVVKLAGGIRWVAQHSGYDPPHQFVDDLVSLPLRWHHVHSFSALSESSTEMTDTVDTPVPNRFLRPMFLYRHRQLADDLTVQRDRGLAAKKSLTVGITGGSGLIGSALAALLSTGGHRVIKLTRHLANNPDERQWLPENPDPELLGGLDAVVHLAGATIAGRFSPTHKKRISESRIGPTHRLAELMGRAKDGPRILLVASAIGYYGDNRSNEWLPEDSQPGEGFLAEVVKAWEAATSPAVAAGIRVVNLRTGIVQSPRGGVLRFLRPLFELGLGGPIGRGEQWLSWIDLDDLTDMYYLALVDERLQGPINAVAPVPVRNKEYARTLAKVLGRPTLPRIPPLGPRLALGREGAQELALASQRVQADRALAAGFRFRRPNLEACLRHQLGRWP